MNRVASYVLAVTVLACVSPALAQRAPASSGEPTEPRQSAQGQRATSHRFDVLEKKIDDVLWHFRLGDKAAIDKVRLTSAPVRMENPTGQGAGNPLIIYAYTFIPKSLGASSKAPLLIFVHGGVHGDFDTSNAHIVGELIDQGYIVVAPEYRGSTGYGGSFYDQIDYGGTEIDDTYAARNWAVENLPQVDPKRVGILGWSHGGFHTLFNIFRWPSAYQVAYAGVPVSDLVQRMGYKSQGYRDLFAGFIGEEAVDNPMEYRKRSPVYHADKLQTPLLIHTNSNDEDVNVMEVEHLIAALEAAGKSFESKVYEDAPGGHAFNRLDTKLARDSRAEVYAFLAKYLTPGR